MHLYRFSCFCCSALFLLILNYSFGAKPKFEGTGHIDFFGYTDCVKLENENTRVILGHQSGGRVLEYSWKGRTPYTWIRKMKGITMSPVNPVVI